MIEPSKATPHIGPTIQGTLDQIYRHELVLPAIQREFVWRPEQICRLFDSIMQGYPFGTFLYWKVEPENRARFKFFDFVLNYHQRDNPHCPPLAEMPDHGVTAVLDGQQRLTALNIGLRGSIARKLPNKWWNNPEAFPRRKLYLDVLWKPSAEDEEGRKYRFEFLTDNRASASSDETCWFPVGEVLSIKNSGPAMTRWLNSQLPQDEVDSAYDVLYRLFEVVRSERLITYYEETNQELDRALQIFIRMNDGGTPLSHSDLLLSIAVAQWTHHDAREEIHKLVDELNLIGTGFAFSKDFVLKAGLMLSDIGSVGFRVDNFSRENMEILERQWADIKQTLMLTVRLTSSFGFNGQNLTAHNSILPIAYYLHVIQPGDAYLTHGRFEDDRNNVRGWLIRSLLKSGVWGSGLDTLLTELRTVIKKHGKAKFPVSNIYDVLARRGRSLQFDEDEIEDLVDMRYGDRLTFALMSFLFSFVDLQNLFHLDHIFPSSRFSTKRLRDANIPESSIPDFQDKKDRLANLQLLQGAINNEKKAVMPDEWLSSRFDDKQSAAYREQHFLSCLPSSITDFDKFYDYRRTILKQEVARFLGR